MSYATMIKNIRNILIVLGFSVLYSCGNSELFDCFKREGEIDSVFYETDQFKDIYLYDDFDVYLVDDTVCKLRIIADENCIKDFQFDVKDSVLSVSGSGSCDLLKDNNIEKKVYIHSPDISGLYIYGSNKVFSEDTLKYERFLIRVYSMISYMDIKVKCDHFFLEQWNATGNYFIEGETVFYHILNHGYSYIYSENLEADYLEITQRSTGNNYVSVNKKIKAYIYGPGNIFYSGAPEINIIERTSSGEVLKINN